MNLYELSRISKFVETGSRVAKPWEVKAILPTSHRITQEIQLLGTTAALSPLLLYGSLPLVGGVSVWLMGELCVSVCILFSSSVLLPGSRNQVFPSLCLRIWPMLPAIQQRRVPVLSLRRPGAGLSTPRPLSMACLSHLVGPSRVHLCGQASSLLQIHPTHTLREILPQHGIRLPQIYVKHRWGGGRGTCRVSTSRALLWSLPFSLVLVEKRRGERSGAGLENGRELGGPRPCSDTPLLLLPTPSPNPCCLLSSQVPPTGTLDAASPTPSTTTSLCSWPFKCFWKEIVEEKLKKLMDPGLLATGSHGMQARKWKSK